MPSTSSPTTVADAGRLAAAAAVALLLHAAVFALGWTRPATGQAPRRVAARVVKIVPPAPPPEPVKPPPRRAAPPVDLTRPSPPPTAARPEPAPPPPPVFGLSARSVGSGGAAFGVRVGNTVAVAPTAATAPAQPAARSQPVATYTVTQLPRILGEPAPNYPPALRSAGIEGDVILEIVVSAAGAVDEARVVESSNGGFDEAALAAIRAVRFAPARQNDTPVAVRIRVPVRFRLR